MASVRNRIKRRPESQSQANLRIERSRHANAVARQLLKDAKKGKRSPVKQKTLLMTFHRSRILDGLFPARKKNWEQVTQRLKSGKKEELSLDGFSLLHDPNKSLKFLRKLAELECSVLSMKVHFPDEYIQDIGSYLVFSDIWHSIRHVVDGGLMQPPVQRVLTKMGLRNEMGVTFHSVSADDADDFDMKNIWTMPVQRRTPIRTLRNDTDFLRPQTADIATDRFGSLVNDWLNANEFKMELTANGMSNLKNIYGELLDNAERHSIANSRDGDWSMAAFMARRKNEHGNYEYVCRVAVMSLGQSIADSFDNAHERIREGALAYAKKMKNRKQSVETLLTLVALQDSITTDPRAFIAGNAGMGMQHAIGYFHTLGIKQGAIESPRMTIISGRSCIMLRDDYIEGKRPPSQPGERLKQRQIWFNKKNDSSEKPDSDYVFDLEENFAGTLITMAFTLNLAYLRDTLESENDQNADD